MSRNQVLVKKIEEALIKEYGESLEEFDTATFMAEAAYDVMEKYLEEQYR